MRFLFRIMSKLNEGNDAPVTKEIPMNKRNWLKLMIVAAIACTTAAYAAAPVKGNPNSKIYHKTACRHYAAKSSTKEFKSEPEAVKAGYEPCKQCAGPNKQTKPEKKK